MAASRHGGYRGTRDREFYLDETRRMAYPLSSRCQDSFPCRRDLRREPNKRGFSNGFHNDCQNYIHRNHSPVIEKRALDCKLGELSSCSGLVEPEPRRDNVGKENGGPVKTEENLTKKRKFSPIVWDRGEMKQRDVGSNRIGKTGEELSVAAGTPDRLLSKTEPSDMLAVSPRHSGMDDGENELGQIEEDIDLYLVARIITSSQWAEDDDMDIIGPKKRKSISPSERDPDKKVTPESGEVTTDGSDRALSRPSGSDRGERENDYIVVDGEQRANHCDCLSKRGYESEFREETPESANPTQRRINMLQGCRSVDEFECLNKINEGTYGVVYRARDKKTGEVVALKRVKMEKEKEGFPMTSLREINILLSLNHPSIVDVKEVVVGSRLDSIFLVMEYMEHDLKGIMETMKQPYSQSEAKCLMLQLLEGVNYLHHNWVLHR